MKRLRLSIHSNRMVCLLFILLMLVNIFLRPVPVSAETHSGTCGDNLAWSLDTTTGVFEISGIGDMGNYDDYHSPAPWNSFLDTIRQVKIHSGVTSIGDYAFWGCSSLTSITIPESVTCIGSGAIQYCSSLTSITIPESVTSIGDSSFWGCSSLTSITIPEGVASIGYYTFYGCSSLTSITIPGSVTSVRNGAFGGCSSLTSINIPEGVTSIGDSAFYGCSSLTSVIIPGGVTSIGDSAFGGCDSLTDVTISEGVMSIGDYAFSECDSLTCITIPGSVTGIGERAFGGCDSLTSVTVSEGVTSIGDWAFYGCRSLTSITISGGVTSIGDSAFGNCYSLEFVYFNGPLPTIGSYAFDWNADDRKLYYNIYYQDSWSPNGETSRYGYPIAPIPLITGFSLDSPMQLGAGLQKSIVITTNPEHASHDPFTYLSQDPGIASVSNDGIITGKAVGTTYIAVTEPTLNVTKLLTVQVFDPVSSLIISGEETPIEYGESIQLTVTISPSSANQTVHWLSTNPSVAVVDQTGLVTGTGGGNTHIIATAVDGSNKSDSFLLEVIRHPESIVLDKEAVDVYTANPVQVKATVLPSDTSNKNVLWSSSDESVAVVENGLVTAIDDGTALVTATTEDGNVSASCQVHGFVSVEEVTLDKDNLLLAIDEKELLVATVLPDNAWNKNLIWTSTDPGVATVEEGEVIGQGEGTAVIAVASEDGGFSAMCWVTVYPEETYQVTFESNGGNAVPPIVVEYGSTIIPPEDPVKNGHTFEGWYKDSALTEKWDFEFDLVLKATTLYAKWALNQYVVIFEVDGGSEVSAQVIGHGGQVTKPADPTNEGYLFHGWYTDEDLTDLYDFTSPVTGWLTLHAKWVKEHILTYQAGANGRIEGEDIQKIEDGHDGTEIIAIPDTGYHFDCWDDGVLTPNRTDTNVQADLTVTATFALNQYEVIFEVNGDSEITSQEISHGGFVIEPEDPTKAGYLFRGWYKDEALTEAYDFASPVTGPLTLYAKWVKEHTLNYLVGANGRTEGEDIQKIEDGHDGTEVTAIPDTGYHFDRWDDGVLTPNRTDTNVQADLTVTATFALNQYVVTFEVDSGSAVPSKEIWHGGQVAKPNNPAKTGYVFVGWYVDAALTKAYDFASPLTGPLTLYACWVKDGWQKKSGIWYYYQNGEPAVGWLKDQGKWYYMGSLGAMQMGWVKDNGQWYYLAANGAMQTGWLKDNNKWYYLASNGAMQTGWLKDNNKWYYLASGGAMQTGWVKDNGKWYYLASGGAMQAGWLKDNGKWYYLAPGGAMQTGWVKDNGKWYYLAANGAMQTGWVKDTGKWYYFYANGSMASNTTIDGYRLGPSGAMQ